MVESDVDALKELLEGYQSMLLSHEKRIGIIEKVLVDAAESPREQPQDHRRKSGT